MSCSSFKSSAKRSRNFSSPLELLALMALMVIGVIAVPSHRTQKPLKGSLPEILAPMQTIVSHGSPSCEAILSGSYSLHLRFLPSRTNDGLRMDVPLYESDFLKLVDRGFLVVLTDGY